MIKRICVLLAIFAGSQCMAQDDEFGDLDDFEEDEAQKVIATFKSPTLINGQTNETTKAGTLDFRITHRFGNVAGNSGGGHSLFGFDNASNIRFSFDYGITNKLQIGVGRSKVKEHIDGSIKYRIYEQKTKGLPFSIGIYANTAFTPVKDLEEKYTKTAHRFSHSAQLVLAGKANWRFSYLVLPTYVHRNLIVKATNSSNNAAETNDLVSLGIAGRFKITHSVALIGEYFHTFSDFRKDNPDNQFYAPLGVGVEIETGGHVFQINLTNSAGIITNDFIPNTISNWGDGEYKIGFTISRVFGSAK